MRDSTRAWMPASSQLGLAAWRRCAARKSSPSPRSESTSLRELLVGEGVGVAEGEVFELAAQLAHAQAVGERSVDVERLAGDALLLFGLQVLERAHVVQAVGELDDDDADVGDHGQQHLADVFGLVVFAVGELDLVELGDAFDDVGDLLAEALGDLRRW